MNHKLWISKQNFIMCKKCYIVKLEKWRGIWYSLLIKKSHKKYWRVVSCDTEKNSQHLPPLTVSEKPAKPSEQIYTFISFHISPISDDKICSIVELPSLLSNVTISSISSSLVSCCLWDRNCLLPTPPTEFLPMILGTKTFRDDVSL